MVAQAFSISPLEVYKMPVNLVKDMLAIHKQAEELKSNELEKMKNKFKV